MFKKDGFPLYPRQFNVQKQLNKNIIIDWILFNNGPGAEKKEKGIK